MAYRLLGLVVWKGAKLFVKRKYGSTAPKAALIGVVVAVLVGAAIVARGLAGGGDDDS